MNVLIASRIDPRALQELELRHDVVTAFNESQEQLCSLLEDREALVFRSGVTISRTVLESGPRLRLLIRAGSGVDNLDLTYVRNRGITFQRIPGPGAQAVAEMTFALLLSVARNVVPSDRLLREGRWAKSEMTGHLLSGRVLGVIGMGSIGSTVARLGVAWGMQVVGCVAHPSDERAEGFAELGIRLTNCSEVLAAADYVTVHVPLEPATQGLIGRDALGRMKNEAIAINIARGGVVDEEALLLALESGQLAGAGLDVHVAEGEGKVSPLAHLPNVVLTPHIGASTFESQREIGETVVKLVDSFADRKREA